MTANAGSPGEVRIRTPDQRLRVFVSSSIAELADERQAVSRAISALRLTPVLFELGARPHPPRELYQAYLAQSDVFIGLYWQGYGRVAPGQKISGLEEEYELSQALPHLLYVKEPAPGREPRLSELLARMKQQTSYRKFRTAAELDQLVRDDLATLLSERFEAAAAADSALGPSPPQARTRPLPASTTSLVGRDEAIDEVAALIELPDVRLVTLTGPGGVGKTRLAVAAGERLRDRFGGDAVFVPLAELTEPAPVMAAIGRAVGADLPSSSPPLQALVERLGDEPWLLILDNLEQAALDVARDLDELLSRCPGVAILATSRTVLRLRAEREYPVHPLLLPADGAGIPVDDLMSSPAVALFVDRARAVRNDFVLTKENAEAVVEICRRLEGLPLAIELAAARIRLLEPDAVLRRLAFSLDALGTGAVDVPERQRTLRATVEWSVNLLDADERRMLETSAVFVDGWTVEAAAAVADLDENRALDLTEALARHSLIGLEIAHDGPRAAMLDTVRAFVGERLDARTDADLTRERHADYYRSLGERADRPLRSIGHNEWIERLETESGNLAAAVRWYLDHDPQRLPHLFRVLWLFWELREHLGEAGPWIDQVLPGADSLAADEQAELLWTATATATEVGDDAAALANSGRLVPLLDQIQDPFIRALSRLAIGWSFPIKGDLDGALREVGGALNELRALDEPYLTTVAALVAGNLEIAVGRYEDARPFLREAQELADRMDYGWPAAWSRAQLGTVAVFQGRLDEGEELLEEGLDLSLGVHNIRNVTLLLSGFARLELSKGEPERAAMLLGAADGLRGRVGVKPWPMQRPGEDELVAQVREVLGSERMDETLAAGSQLSLARAVALVQPDGSGAREDS